MSSFIVAAVLFCNAHTTSLKSSKFCVYDLGACAAKFEREHEYFKSINSFAHTKEQSQRAEAQAQCFLFYKAGK